jgi:hypothetical protein
MYRLLACITLLATLMIGCSSGPPMATVRGNVTYDGKPVDGTIQFKPDTESPAEIPIKNGAYSGRTPPGPCRVIIRASDGSIPAKHNDMSGKQVEVKEGTNDFDFPLEK